LKVPPLLKLEASQHKTIFPPKNVPCILYSNISHSILAREM